MHLLARLLLDQWLLQENLHDAFGGEEQQH
jgi:hypothetical protein